MVDPWLAGDGSHAVLVQCVDHAVPDKMDLACRNTFAVQVLVAAGLRREKQIREVVGHDPVDFLGHRPVARAQAGLDVSHRNAALRRHQRTRDGGVHIARDHDEIGATLFADLVKTHHDLSCLPRLVVGADLEVNIGQGHAELIEEDLRHRAIIMLAGMHQQMWHIPCGQRLDERRHLHEIRPRPHDVADQHAISFPNSR